MLGIKCLQLCHCPFDPLSLLLCFQEKVMLNSSLCFYALPEWAHLVSVQIFSYTQIFVKMIDYISSQQQIECYNSLFFPTILSYFPSSFRSFLGLPPLNLHLPFFFLFLPGLTVQPTFFPLPLSSSIFLLLPFIPLFLYSFFLDPLIDIFANSRQHVFLVL